MSRQPNILLIHCDSMDGRAMGWMNHPAAHTPNLDRLAARGTAFTRAYCNSPQCVPSRSSFMTGRHVHEVEAWNNFKGLEPDDWTIFDDAAMAGYRVREVGRRGYASGGHSLGARLTAWVRSSGIELPQKAPPQAKLIENTSRVRGPDWQRVDEAVDLLQSEAAQSQTSDQPLFMSLGFIQPHPGAGYRTSPHYRDRIPSECIAMPPDDALEHPVMRHMSVAKHTADPLPESEVRRIRHHYLAMIAEVDAMVGQVLDALEATSLAQHTIVVFLADHGDMQMEHRQWLKNALYEASARVPLIFAGPGIASGHRVDTPVSLIDLRATLARLMRHSASAHTSGWPLDAALRGEAAPEAPVFAEYHSNMQCTGSFMLCQGNWKYIAYPGYPPQLFNLAEDPQEMNNLAPGQPRIAERMDASLRGICDYPDIDRRAKANDRQCFRAWRAAVSDETYRSSMETILAGFGDEHHQLIDQWLEHGDAARRNALDTVES